MFCLDLGEQGQRKFLQVTGVLRLVEKRTSRTVPYLVSIGARGPLSEPLITAWVERAVAEVAVLPFEMAGIIGAVVGCPLHPVLTLEAAENKK